MEETYPGTDMLRRFCYGCQVEIPTLEEMWVDQDEDVAVCTSCKERAEASYPGQTSFVRATELLAEDLNALE